MSPISKLYWTGLSPRLLLLTLICVMVCEIFIFAPSIARFRYNYLLDKIGGAHLTVMAARSVKDFHQNDMPQNRITNVEVILSSLMMNTIGVLHVHIEQNTQEVLANNGQMGNPAYTSTQATYDLTDAALWHLIPDALDTLISDQDQQIRVIAPSPHDPLTKVTIILDEYPMIVEMREYGWRILLLSLVIACITALLVFLTLQKFMVIPIKKLSAAMICFRQGPENPHNCLSPSQRQDEIGIAENEFSQLQQEIQSLLGERARLAALGSAVTKIHHDLRNILSIAILSSDPLTLHSDPKVQKFADSLIHSLERATSLCSQTMKYAQHGKPESHLAAYSLADILDKTGIDLNPNGAEEQCPRPDWQNKVSPDLQVWVDQEHLMRILDNLGRNAYQAGATDITLTADIKGSDQIQLYFQDNGPGLPPRAQENLFKPFAGSAKSGGTGLGLPTALELARLMEGDLCLDYTNETGSGFIITLPRYHIKQAKSA